MVSMTVSPNPVQPGQPVTYEVFIRNIGTAAADDVVFTDLLASGATFLSCTPSVGTCSAPLDRSGGIVTANLGTILPDGVVSVTIVITTAASSGVLVNVATVSSSTPDINPDNNSATTAAGVGVTIPTLEPRLLLLFAIALAGAALWILRGR